MGAEDEVQYENSTISRSLLNESGSGRQKDNSV